MPFKLSREEMMSADPMLLRMHLRERAHHLMELPLYAAVYGGRQLGEKAGESVDRILDLWEERGLPNDLPDLEWVYRLRELLAQIKAGDEIDFAGPEKAHSSCFLSGSEMKVVDTLIRTRRSHRQWKDQAVPSGLVQKILTAGLWAPSTCNYQVARFIVIDKKRELERFANVDFGLEQVKIVACADRRPWDDATVAPPEKNLYLEIGAVMQNMALVAHSLGLGACWSTFTNHQTKSIREYYDLPHFVEVVTYLAIGWPTGSVLPPQRIGWQEAVLND